jgi:hypothetical protein
VLPNLSRQNRDARISVAGSTHRITQRGLDNDDDDDDDDDDEVKVSGDVTGISGTCPNLRFTVRGTAVITSSSTEFRRGSCQDVRAGRAVEVDGIRLSDGAIAALRVELR